MLSVTRLQVETLLAQRVSGWLTISELSIGTLGSSAVLNDPIGYAIRILGGTVADPSNVVDADIQTLDDDQLDALLDVAEVRALENAQGALFIDAKAGPVEAKRSAHGARLLAIIKDKKAALAINYGIGGVYGALSITMQRVDGYTCTDGDY